VTGLNRDGAERIFRKLQIRPSYSTHLVSGWLWLDGKIVGVLHYSNENADMSDLVFHRLRRALHLAPEEFARLCGCTMSKQHYEWLLSARLVPEVPPAQ
jgi:hypothetical protein